MQSRAVRQPVTPTRSQMYIILGAAIFLLLAGAALVIFGVVFVRDATASANWPTTTGRVQNVRVTWDNVGSSGPPVVREYYYAVTYAYTVEGERYTGTRYSLGGGSNAAGRTFDTEDEARTAAAAAYRVGQDLAVSYDPAMPAEAVLQTGVQAGTYVPLVLGAFFLLCGGMFFWLFLRMRLAFGNAP
jgi:hypothetical protein